LLVGTVLGLPRLEFRLSNCVVQGRAPQAQLVMYSFSITGHLDFGEMLRGHRRAARLTLEQLAEVSGVSARTLSDIERGRSKGPQQRTVTALADALALQGDARKQLVAAGARRQAAGSLARAAWARPRLGIRSRPAR
jgi:transcriptional regulator with XRE-family HTH domain